MNFEFGQADDPEGSYKNGLIGKLSMKVSDYYKSALAAANSTDFPSAGFFPPVRLIIRSSNIHPSSELN